MTAKNFTTNLRHYLNDDLTVPQDLKPSARELLFFLASLVGWMTSSEFRGTMGPDNMPSMTNVFCIQKAGK